MTESESPAQPTGINWKSKARDGVPPVSSSSLELLIHGITAGFFLLLQRLHAALPGRRFFYGALPHPAASASIRGGQARFDLARVKDGRAGVPGVSLWFNPRLRSGTRFGGAAAIPPVQPYHPLSAAGQGLSSPEAMASRGDHPHPRHSSS